MEKLNYKSIPKFTSWGSWRVNMPLDSIDDWITKEEKENGLQLNPDFQRGHVWTEEQQIKYVEFLLKEGQSSREIFFNHPGWMTSFNGEFVCVDGLQRLTAVRKFNRNELPVFGGYYYDDIDRIPSMHITLIFNVNNLQTRKEVLQWYLEFNTGGTVHTEKELDKVRMLLEKENNINL